MRALLFLLFVVAPLVELVVIIQVGQVIGIGWTIGLLVADSLLGAWLLGRESRHVWGEFRRAMAEGRWPGDEVAQGAMVLVGGTLLLTPGFVTDVIGFVLLLRPSRVGVARILRTRVTPTVARRARTVGAAGRRGTSGDSARSDAAADEARGRSGGRGGRSGADGGAEPPRGNGRGDIIDVEVVEIRRESPPPADDVDGEVVVDPDLDDGPPSLR